MDFSSGSPPPLPLGHVQEQLGNLIPTLCVHPDVSRPSPAALPEASKPRPPSCWGSLGAPLPELGMLCLFQRGWEDPFSLFRHLLDVSFHDPQHFPASGSQPGNAELPPEPLPQREFGIFTLDLEFLGLPCSSGCCQPSRNGSNRDGNGAGECLGGFLSIFFLERKILRPVLKFLGWDWEWQHLCLEPPDLLEAGEEQMDQSSGRNDPILHWDSFSMGRISWCFGASVSLSHPQLAAGIAPWKNNFREFVCRIPLGFGW